MYNDRVMFRTSTEEDTMPDERMSKELREIILTRIAQRLSEKYHEVAIPSSEEYLVASLAFKGDPELNELRLALERLNRGDYGRCIFCKETINTDKLRHNPVAHFCENCSQVLRARIGSASSGQQAPLSAGGDRAHTREA